MLIKNSPYLSKMSLRQIAGKAPAIWRGNLFERLFCVAHECETGF